jgi:hypothetical protein
VARAQTAIMRAAQRRRRRNSIRTPRPRGFGLPCTSGDHVKATRRCRACLGCSRTPARAEKRRLHARISRGWSSTAEPILDTGFSPTNQNQTNDHLFTTGGNGPNFGPLTKG